MLFAALTNSVCLNNASFFFSFKYFLCQGYELSGEIALKNNHYYYYVVISKSYATELIIMTNITLDNKHLQSVPLGYNSMRCTANMAKQCRL